MSNYVILTDSSCDLPAAVADKLGLVVIPLSVFIEGQVYQNFLDEREIASHDFYELLRKKSMASTSAANVAAFTTVIEPLLQSGTDVLYLGFSSALSGTYQAGRMAAEELSEKYPDRKVLTVDTLCASMGQGLLVYLTAEQQQAGASIEEARDFAEKTKGNILHWFTVEDLFHLKRGGRVSAATAVVGSLLSIKPVMHVDDEGRLINMEKARGRRQSIQSIAKKIIDRAIDLSKQTIFISHGDCPEDAQQLAEIVKAAGAADVLISPVGPVIGSHSGPGTLAIFCVGTER